MKRGDLFYIIPPRQLGKQRLALAVQSTLFLPEAHGVAFCLMTGAIDFVNPVRILVSPTKGNGLAMPSLIQVDKLVTVDRDRIKNRIGSSPQRRWLASTLPCACGWESDLLNWITLVPPTRHRLTI